MDGEGRFRIRGLAPGTYRLRAGARGYPEAVEEGVRAVAGQESGGHTFILERGGTLVLRLRGCRDTLSPYFVLHLEREGGPVLDYRHQQVAEDGSWRREQALQPGRWEVMVTFIGYDPLERKLEIAAGERVSVTFRGKELKKSRYQPDQDPTGPITVKGVLTDDRGRPLPGVRLFFVGMTLRHLPFQERYVKGTTDARGAFALAGFRPGTWRVTGHTKEGGEPQFKPLLIPKAAAKEWCCKLVLPAGKVTGNLADRGSGEPFGGKEPVWWVFLKDRRTGRVVSELNGGHRGPRFTLVGVPPGEYVLKINASGYAARETEPFTLVRGQELDLGTLALDRRTLVDLEVRDGQGRPVKSYQLYVNGRSIPLFRGREQKGGRRRFQDLPTGPVRLRIRAAGYREKERQVDLKPGPPTLLRFTLTPE